MADRKGAMTIAREADKLGFSHIGINDHVVVPTEVASRYPYTEGGEWPGRVFGEALELLTTMAFVAGCTEQIRILSSVMILPYRPAVLTAKMLATADVLSNGRIIAGCGVGWMLEEFEALGSPPFKGRGAVTDEYLNAFFELWEKEDPEYHGRHVQFANIRFMPKPVQRPRLPVWVGGESELALRRVVRSGDGWYPASNNPKRPLDTPERVAPAIADLARMSEEAGRDPASIDVCLLLLSPIDWSAQSKDGRRRMFTGNAADMAGDAAALEAIGVGHVSLMFQAVTVEETIARMQRFAAEVTPML